jgi:hypothetical protein
MLYFVVFVDQLLYQRNLEFVVLFVICQLSQESPVTDNTK